MKCQTQFSGKNRRHMLKCYLVLLMSRRLKKKQTKKVWETNKKAVIKCICPYLNSTGERLRKQTVQHWSDCCSTAVLFLSFNILGPVVQSVVSLTSWLRVISLTVLVDSIYNILIFFAEKMWVAFEMQKLLIFFQQKISEYLRIIRCKF